MRRLVSIVVASMALFFVSFTSSMAEWAVGLSASGGLYEAEGSEQLRAGAGASTAKAGRKNTATEAAKFFYPSIFVEYNTGTVSIGLDVIPGAVETEEAVRTDYNLGGSAGVGNDGTGSAVVNKASVEISRHVTLYALIPIMDSGAFLKAGISRMEVETNESLATGSTYGNEDNVPGLHAGLGYQHDTDGGFVRAEIGYSKYDNIRLKSDGGNTVEADIQGGFARISIGRSF